MPGNPVMAILNSMGWTSAAVVDKRYRLATQPANARVSIDCAMLVHLLHAEPARRYSTLFGHSYSGLRRRRLRPRHHPRQELLPDGGRPDSGNFPI